ncbi:ABC-F family ATP-binding cassette domain-containing protein [Actinomadura livida]|uniref:ABC-F family ATP-binding cassette domain-containing protein n=1 Tax=Actinomadura livida TaxID=79909 RepID=A0A7W7N0N0_9ACTN|nr:MULTISPECIES: ABC-F family ATP-binding cassette domain-containing protein [Actinomadura]MBB4777095.1 macrolide transport system ATP-binding/permease protein [Actinomadura catellatispora]GGU21747.1 ABC transporter ATP-binding protein [Actinomadura livida]
MNTLSITLPARARVQLTAEGVRVVRGGRTVLDGVDLTVSPQARWGVVGENGRGKTTLLHVLSGALVPDEGHVRRVGTLGIAEQAMAAGPGATVGQAIDMELADARAALKAFDEATRALSEGRPGAERRYEAALDAAEALDAWDADRRVDLALENLGAVTDRSMRLSELSVGQRYRVRLACLLGAEHDFLLLDEPTNHLDAAGLRFLTARLRAHPGGVVVVSHDRALLADVATTVLDLDPSRDGLPRVYGDGYAGYREGREAELRRWEEEYERQRTEHARLTRDLSEAQNRLVTGWRPDKGTGKHQRATRAPGIVRSVHRRRDDLERHAVTAPVPPRRFRMPDLPARPGVPLLTADGVRVDGRLHCDVSLSLESGSRLVVTGPNGAGKSTLLAVLAGRLAPSRGYARRAPNTRVESLAQESPHVDGRAHDVFAAHVGRLVTSGLIGEDETVSLSALGLLSADDLGKPVGNLSMGQQRRLDLAMVLAARPHVLLLDEPTNHLSIALVDELTEALRATPAAVVLATHDRQLQRDTEGWPRLALDPERPLKPVPQR